MSEDQGGENKESYKYIYIYKLRRKARYWGITNLLVSAEPSGPVEPT